jgi:hypothetical protein
MLTFNYLYDSGGFKEVPNTFIKGKEGLISYSNHVIAQFLFINGIAMRLVILNDIKKVGFIRAHFKIIFPRVIGLLFISLCIYGIGPEVQTWFTLKNKIKGKNI